VDSKNGSLKVKRATRSYERSTSKSKTSSFREIRGKVEDILFESLRDSSLENREYALNEIMAVLELNDFVKPGSK